MLNNNLLFSLIISIVSSGIIYLFTNKSEVSGSNYTSKDLLIIFSTIFCITYAVNGFCKKDTIEPTINVSGETLLSHSSRPPF